MKHEQHERLDEQALAEANERLAKMGVTGVAPAIGVTIDGKPLNLPLSAYLNHGATVSEEAQTILQTAAPSQAPVRKRISVAQLAQRYQERIESVTGEISLTEAAVLEGKNRLRELHTLLGVWQQALAETNVDTQ